MTIVFEDTKMAQPDSTLKITPAREPGTVSESESAVKYACLPGSAQPCPTVEPARERGPGPVHRDGPGPRMAGPEAGPPSRLRWDTAVGNLKVS